MKINDKNYIDELINKGIALIELGKYQEALEVFDKALEIDPRNGCALGNKGVVLINFNRYREALVIFDEILKVDSQNIKTLNNKRIALIRLDQYQEALEVCNRILEIDPENMNAKSDKGDILFELGKYQEALKIFNEILEIDPRNGRLLFNKGVVLINLNRYQEAFKILNEALKIDPKNILVLSSKGIALTHLNQYQEAIEVYNEILEIDPKDISALSLKIDVLFKLYKYQEALKVIDEILEIDSRNEDALKNRNFVLLELNKNNTSQQIESTESNETYLFFDTETTGLPRDWNASVDDVDNWPRIVQISWVIYRNGIKISSSDFIIKPEGFRIPTESSNVHGITTERAEKEGVSLQAVLTEFQNLIEQADLIIAHNISFDEKIVGAEFIRKNMSDSLESKKTICTMKKSTDFCAIPSSNGHNDYKWPKLSELYMKLFDTEFEDAHNSFADVNATAKCFWEMKKRGIL